MIGHVSIPEAIQMFEPDLVFLFNDPQILLAQLKYIPSTLRTIVYATFDGLPVPPEYVLLSRVHKLVTMSHFSKGASGNNLYNIIINMRCCKEAWMAYR